MAPLEVDEVVFLRSGSLVFAAVEGAGRAQWPSPLEVDEAVGDLATASAVVIVGGVSSAAFVDVIGVVALSVFEDVEDAECTVAPLEVDEAVGDLATASALVLVGGVSSAAFVDLSSYVLVLLGEEAGRAQWPSPLEVDEVVDACLVFEDVEDAECTVAPLEVEVAVGDLVTASALVIVGV